MKKYAVKHKNINHLQEVNAYLKYYTEINLKHIVFRREEATKFETEKRAKEMINKFKFPDNWEVVVVHYGKKR